MGDHHVHPPLGHHPKRSVWPLTHAPAHRVIGPYQPIRLLTEDIPLDQLL